MPVCALEILFTLWYELFDLLSRDCGDFSVRYLEVLSFFGLDILNESIETLRVALRPPIASKPGTGLHYAKAVVLNFFRSACRDLAVRSGSKAQGVALLATMLCALRIFGLTALSFRVEAAEPVVLPIAVAAAGCSMVW